MTPALLDSAAFLLALLGAISAAIFLGFILGVAYAIERTKRGR